MAEAIPWFPFNADDYLRDTQHLTTPQHGAYLLLILHYWQHGGLPDDDHVLARIVRQPLRNWLQMRQVIAALFHGDGPWRHKRIDQEMNRASGLLRKRTMAASRAGTMSAIKRAKTKADANAASTSRARDVHAGSTPRAHNNNSKITTTTSEAARAREGQEPTAASERAAAPAGLAEEPAASPHTIGSPALAAAMQRKGWVR